MLRQLGRAGRLLSGAGHYRAAPEAFRALPATLQEHVIALSIQMNTFYLFGCDQYQYMASSMTQLRDVSPLAWPDDSLYVSHEWKKDVLTIALQVCSTSGSSARSFATNSQDIFNTVGTISPQPVVQ